MKQLIDRNELKSKIDRGERIVLLEALPERYYRKGHLPGALSFPHDQVAELAPKLVADKAAQVVVYCANVDCQNSHLAATELGRLGYTNVSVYAEGKAGWEAAGLPLVRDAA